jgi:stalled ribosome alternative rescue factor ArfA
MEERMMKKETTLDKRIFKKSPEELQLYMHFKKRGFVIENKKGKGSYKRKPKHAEHIEY